MSIKSENQNNLSGSQKQNYIQQYISPNDSDFQQSSQYKDKSQNDQFRPHDLIMQTSKNYKEKMLLNANPILDQIQQLDEQQQEQDILVNNYYQSQFENKQTLKQKFTQSLNLLENKDYYGTNNPEKLFERDVKQSQLHPRQFQFIRYCKYNQQSQKNVLYKQLKNPYYNSEHDILTKQQRLSKIYTKGFKKEDMMTPREKRIHLKTQKNLKNNSDINNTEVLNNLIQYRPTTANDNGSTVISQYSQNNLEEEVKDKIQDLYINRDPAKVKNELKRSNTIVKSDSLNIQSINTAEMRRMSKKVNFIEIEKQVSDRNKLKNLNINQDLSLDQLQKLRQKMLNSLLDTNQSVSSKAGIIQSLFETELKDGNKKVYQEKLQIQREKQKQEMLSRQQAFNSFYNLLALNNKSKKNIFKKQINIVKEKEKSQQNSSFMSFNQESSAQGEKRAILSRFQLNSNISGKQNIKNAQSKISSGISKRILNRIIGIDPKSNSLQKKEVLYVNPYTNKVYTNHD